MIEFFQQLKAGFQWIDLVDILLVSLLLYRLLLLIRGTRAMQMLTGLLILGIGFFLSSTFELYTSHWLLSYFFDYLFLIVVVLFQDDLRRALTHMGKNPFFAGLSELEEIEMVDEIARAATQMAKSKIGALMVLERETGLKNLIDTGSVIEARVKSEILFSIFTRDSPIHDGAVIITGGKIAAAGCFLPLTKDPDIDRRYGTRHRAALGVSEETDAVVVLVSEETSEVHLVKNGRMTVNLTENELRESLFTLLELKDQRKGFTRGIPKRLKSWFDAVSKGDKK